MPYNFAAGSFHTKKIKRSAILNEYWPFCVLSPRVTYDDHLRLIGKSVVDFLLVLIELFSL